ncbi:MAG: hypothetical protein KC931_24500, partial [Candidatus Omnitrophica bacterium]|nr:hypothetical protein [Candidatus Omnitrophota bacterium]
FPFEKPLLEEAGIPTEFVGHPLVDQLGVIRDRETILRETGLESLTEKRLIGLLPGSRHREVERLLPVLLEAAERIHRDFPDTHFIVPLASSIPMDRIQSRIDSQNGSRVPLSIVEEPPKDFRSILHFSITKSGTSTLENAVMGVPQIVVYKGRPLDAWIARRVVRVQWLGLVNLIAGREICPELLQEECTPEEIFKATATYLADAGKRDRMLEEMAKVRDSLGESGASKRTAAAICHRIKEWTEKNH